MDNLEHIDDLLKKASQVPANALVDDSDWLAVENRLRKRKNRIYVMWFFLALVFLSSSSVLLYKNYTTIERDIISLNDEPTIESEEALNEASSLDNNDITTLSITDTNSENTAQDLKSRNVSLSEKVIPTDYSADLETPNLIVNTNRYKYTFIDRPFLSQKSILSIYSDYSDPKLLTPEIEEIATLPLHLQKGTNSNIKRNINTKNHWEIGISFTPSLSGKSVSIDQSFETYLNRSYFDKVLSSESLGFSTSFGLNAQYHFAKRWFIGTGLYSTERSEALNYNYVIDEIPATLNGPIVDYLPVDPRFAPQVSYSGSNSYHFIQIPLNLGFKQRLSSNFELRSQIGVSYLQLLSQTGKKADTRNLELKDLTDFSLSSRNLGANARIGIYYHTKRLTFGAEPILNRQINTLTTGPNNPLVVKPYSYGFNLTTNLKLIK